MKWKRKWFRPLLIKSRLAIGLKITRQGKNAGAGPSKVMDIFFELRKFISKVYQKYDIYINKRSNLGSFMAII